MKRVVVNSLSEFNEILPGRKVCNTTRMADHVVSLLYAGYSVEVRDPYKMGSHRQANEYLVRVVLKLLNQVFVNKYFRFDYPNCRLELVLPVLGILGVSPPMK